MERIIKDINNERWGKLWKKQMRIKQSKQWVAYMEPLTTYIYLSVVDENLHLYIYTHFRIPVFV